MASPSRNEVAESPLEQWAGEKVPYAFDFSRERTEGLTTVTSPVVRCYDVSGLRETDVSATVIAAGSPSVSGATVTTTAIQNLTAGRTYRLECQVDSGGGRYILWARIRATP